MDIRSLLENCNCVEVRGIDDYSDITHYDVFEVIGEARIKVAEVNAGRLSIEITFNENTPVDYVYGVLNSVKDI
ncbi:MAG: hypothetical protein PHS04_07915 [Tissierellia bacterium]|nr:hypothetical protein [Tissierellia bacterium]